MKGLVLALVLAAGPAGFAGSGAPSVAPPTAFPFLGLASAGGSSGVSGGISDAGMEVARTISEVTGVAISPLLGMGVVGAWRYYRAPEAERAGLPWFAQPWFWGAALLLVGLVAAKDALGPVTPTVLKKPFDILEAMENKVSGLIAAGLFVPLIVGMLGDPGGGAALDTMSGAGFAAVSGTAWYEVLLTPFAVVAFVVVWLLAHVINVLILLSPFATLDLGLKLVRMALLGTVVGSSFVNPWVGAVWALGIILVALLLAGWSFRLSVLGTVLVWDVVTRHRRRFRPDPRSNRVFLARPLGKIPVRTYGRLVRDEAGGLRLRYRRYLVGPAREAVLPAGEHFVGRGLVYGDLRRIDAGQPRRVAILPPRYQGHEDELTRIYALSPPRDLPLRAAWVFLVEALGFRSARRVGAAEA